MKVRKIVQKMYAAILENDREAEKALWLKALKKSLKHKKTYNIY